MNQKPNRRQVLKAVGMAGIAGAVVKPDAAAAEPPLRIAGRDVEIQVTAISDRTLRVSVIPLSGGRLEAIPYDGALLVRKWREPAVRIRTASRATTLIAKHTMEFLPDPLSLHVSSGGTTVQQIAIDRDTGALTFSADSALLWLRRRWPTVRPARIEGHDAQRAGRLPLAHPRGGVSQSRG